MGARFLSLVSVSNRLLVFRAIGEFSGEQIVRNYHDFIATDASFSLFRIILDLRLWVGLATDYDLELSAEMGRSVRQKHGVLNAPPPALVYLAKPGAGVQIIAERMAKLRGTPVPTVHAERDAWALIEPNLPIPKEVAIFLRSRIVDQFSRLSL